MKKDAHELNTLVRTGGYIAGIHNYCDAWCERCPFTSRCFTFALEGEEYPEPESLDIRHEAFWENLKETLHAGLAQLREIAELSGVERDADGAGDIEETERMEESLAMNHGCCHSARVYAGMVDRWFHHAKGLVWQELPEDGDEYPAETPDPEEQDAAYFGAELQEALEVVRWDQHQIAVKLHRAVRSQMNESREWLDDVAKDSEGSAKVALLGIDRSMAAWAEIESRFPLLSAETKEMQRHLRQMRAEVEKTFPGARSFIRPGFDKVPLSS